MLFIYAYDVTDKT